MFGKEIMGKKRKEGYLKVPMNGIGCLMRDIESNLISRSLGQ